MNRRIALFKDPPKKYNLKFNAVTDFILSAYPDPELAGKYIKSIPIDHLNFKYLYIPPTICKLYLRRGSYLIPAVQNVFIPLNRITKLILVRPDDVTSGNIYFQYWITNVESVKVLDIIDWYDFTLVKNGVFQKYELPFPSYQLKILLNMPSNPTSIDYNVSSYPFNGNGSFILDNQDGITGSPLSINNFYKYGEVGGSGEITDPNYPFPSWRTHIGLINNDVTNDIEHCKLKVISWLGDL